LKRDFSSWLYECHLIAQHSKVQYIIDVVKMYFEEYIACIDKLLMLQIK